MKINFRYLALLILPAVSSYVLQGCASAQLPEEHHDRYTFPPYSVYIEEPTGKAVGMPYQVLGWVRTRVSFPTMEQAVNNPMLCKNYYNKGAKDLLREAQKVHADAVVKVRSVVYNMDGTMQEFPSPECSDDGAEGEILMRGVAIKFGPKPASSPSQANPAFVPANAAPANASGSTANEKSLAQPRAAEAATRPAEFESKKQTPPTQVSPERTISSVSAPTADGGPSSEHHQ